MIQEAAVPAGAPLVSQVSRWDSLKDPIGLIDCFAEHVLDPAAHLLLAGPDVKAVADDPEGAEVLEQVIARRAALDPEARARVHLAMLPLDDIEENAAIVNAVQRRSRCGRPEEHRRGFRPDRLGGDVEGAPRWSPAGSGASRIRSSTARAG